MNFSHFFIDRPVLAIVLSILITLAGGLALVSLPVAQYPTIAPPTVTVSATYAGANAETVAKTVATPIEQQLNGVENLLYLSSQSTNTGQMRITATFRVGTDLDTAQVQVQNRVAIAEPQLPAEVRQSGVVVRKSSPDFTAIVQIYSPDGRYDPLFVSNYATLQVRDELLRVEGVGDINVFGVRDYSMRLWLDPPQMASRSVTVGDVIGAVQEQNVQVASGTVGGPPLPRDSAPFQLSVTAQGRLTTPEQFRDIVVKTGDDGRITYLRDIGHVELGAADYGTSLELNGRPAVGIGVFQLPGTNSIATANALRAKMQELTQKSTWLPGLAWSMPYDTTVFVKESLRDVVKTLVEAVLLVVLVVLVFLQSWRASIIPVLAVPVSLIGTFAALWAFGFSLNTLSLFGLVLAIGIVVDDAIVVVENVERLLEEGHTPREATYKAMSEVTPAIIAIAFGLSAVFIPVAFISGITGQFYRQFALTIAFSTILSAINSLTLSPALAALLLRPKHAKKDFVTRGLDFAFGWFFRLFNRGLEKGTNGYVALLRRIVRFSAVALVVYVGLCFLAFLGFQRVPTGFIPAQDQGTLIVNVQLPDASSINRTQAAMHRMSELARDVEGVSDAIAVSGFSVLTGAQSSAGGTMFLVLDPFEARVGKEALSAGAIRGRLAATFAQVQEASALVLQPPPVRGIGSAGGFKMMVEDRSGLATPQELQSVVAKVADAARQRPELEPSSLFSGFRANVPQLYADVNRTQAKQQNVAVTDVYQTLQAYLGGIYINDFNYLGRTWRVIAQADSPYRATAEDIAQLKTRNAAGQMVPLGTVLDVRDIAGPDRIARYNLYNAAELNGSAKAGVSTGEALAAMEQVAAEVLPTGYAFEWTELAYQERLAGNTALLVFPLCILFVYLTHAAEYESFPLSTAIILIVPMCLLAGIAGVAGRGLDNNIFTQIGFIVLAGMSVKNAVLIVEFAKQREELDPTLPPSRAAVEAAHLRLRPILMTSLAFILGTLPMVIATGAGAEMRRALGTVVFWGMIGVTIFGIFFTPVFFTAIRWLLPARHKRLDPEATPH